MKTKNRKHFPMLGGHTHTYFALVPASVVVSRPRYVIEYCNVLALRIAHIVCGVHIAINLHLHRQNKIDL